MAPKFDKIKKYFYIFSLNITKETYMKIDKNDVAFKELKILAEQKGKKLKELLTDEQYEKEVCDIFYKNMPKVIRWSMNAEKFKTFYALNKDKFVQQIPDNV